MPFARRSGQDRRGPSRDPCTRVRTSRRPVGGRSATSRQHVAVLRAQVPHRGAHQLVSLRRRCACLRRCFHRRPIIVARERLTRRLTDRCELVVRRGLHVTIPETVAPHVLHERFDPRRQGWARRHARGHDRRPGRLRCRGGAPAAAPARSEKRQDQEQRDQRAPVQTRQNTPPTMCHVKTEISIAIQSARTSPRDNRNRTPSSTDRILINSTGTISVSSRSSSKAVMPRSVVPLATDRQGNGRSPSRHGAWADRGSGRAWHVGPTRVGVTRPDQACRAGQYRRDVARMVVLGREGMGGLGWKCRQGMART